MLGFERRRYTLETFIKKSKREKKVFVDTQFEKMMRERTPLIEQCAKIVEKKNTICSRADGKFCSVYAFPDKKWRLGCPLADEFLRHIITEDQKDAGKVRVGQQKQKKKSR
jgi:hypothetical protein